MEDVKNTVQEVNVIDRTIEVTLERKKFNSLSPYLLKNFGYRYKSIEDLDKLINIKK